MGSVPGTICNARGSVTTRLPPVLRLSSWILTIVLARQRDRNCEQASVQRLFDRRLDLTLASQLQSTERALLGQAPPKTNREQAQQRRHHNAGNLSLIHI